ncbi:MAG: hypothetical protein AB8G23_12890 [Myxococcota bacterium]
MRSVFSRALRAFFLIVLTGPSLGAGHAFAGPLDRICTAAPVKEKQELPRVNREEQCISGPTTRIGLNVNLDGSGSADLSVIVHPSLGVRNRLFSHPLRIRDADGQEQDLLLEFESFGASNQWHFELTASAQALQSSRATAVSPSLVNSLFPGPVNELLFPADPRHVVSFDADGRLLPPTSFEMPVPEASSDRSIVVDFTTQSGSSTQYAGQSIVNEIENDSEVCSPVAPTAGSCFLPEAARAPRWTESGRPPGISSEGYFETSDGDRIQGFRIDPISGQPADSPSDIRVPLGTLPPRATQTARFVLELAPVPEENTSLRNHGGHQKPTFSVTFRYFDRLGQNRQGTLILSEIEADRWRWTPLMTGGGLLFSETETIENFYEDIGGELHFGPSGVLEAVTSRTPRHLEFDPPLSSLAHDLLLPPFASLDFDFGIGETFLGDEIRILAIEQDGYSSGVLQSVELSPEAQIIGGGSNGVQYALAEFAFAERGDPKCSFACSNGRDDDHDGFRDYPDDPGCLTPLDDLETTPSLPCDDGRDNDGDGKTDFPSDPRCEGPRDADESPAELGLKVVQLRKPGKENPGQLIVAVLDRGGKAATKIDRSTAQLVKSDRTLLSPNAAPVELAIDSPDANCDGHEDALLRFSGDYTRTPLKDLCVQGKADGIDFQACTPNRNLP